MIFLLKKIFRHLINFNDGHCRSLDTIAGRFNPEIESWNEDWTEYIHMSIRSDSDGDDDDNDNYIIILSWSTLQRSIPALSRKV